MAYVALDKFEGYADEANLAGASGGSGWSANWVNSATNLIYSDTAQNYETSGLVSSRVVSNAGNTFYTRTFTAITSGTFQMYVAMRSNSNSAGTNAFTLRSSTGGRINVSLNQEAAGKLSTFSGTWTTIISGISANQWYVVEINADVDAATYTMRAHNGTIWSSLTTSKAFTSSGNIDRVGIGGDTGASSWVDYIDTTNPIVTATTNSNFLLFM